MPGVHTLYGSTGRLKMEYINKHSLGPASESTGEVACVLREGLLFSRTFYLMELLYANLIYSAPGQRTSSRQYRPWRLLPCI